MRGRARLVFSVVTVGGICAAFVAPNASLATASITSPAPGRNRAPIRSPGAIPLTVGRPAPYRAANPATLPQAALVAIVAATTKPPANPLGAIAAVSLASAPVATAPAPPVPAIAAPAAGTAPSPARAPGAAPIVTPPTSPSGVWACIRQHESGGNYATNTGNGYYGAYQFSLATWRGIGGTGSPSQAPPAVQDAMAQKLQQRSGWGQWSTHSMCGV